MYESLTNSTLAAAARQCINQFFDDHTEWFYTLSDGNAHAVRRDEMEIMLAQGRLIFSCWTEHGTRSWRIGAWEWSEEKLRLEASRRMGAERPVIEIIPRASASSIAATVKAARLVRCEQLAQLTCTLRPASRVERLALSPGIRRGQPGRYARIVLRQKHQRIAVTGSTASSKASETDAFLSSALLWFERLSDRARPPYIQRLFLIVERDGVKQLTQRIALLRASLQDAIVVYEIDDYWTALTEIPVPPRKDLWKRKLARFPAVPERDAMELAEAITAEAPEAIDIVHARHGKTLRYFGLPFARVRSVMSTERIWFGVESSQRRLLEEKTQHAYAALLADLREHRSAEALDHRHALYRNAGEAWLESILRRDITQLDPGLIIAPLHAQFRTAKGGRLGVRPIDMLALRQDGRLVVIELKVSEDREHVLQGADYWQRVEAHRRRGHIARARLFGEREISDESPLVYLVAPTLRVHPAFQTLARSISSDIEIYRFDINEAWRSGVRVMRRMRVN
ncbi:MAG: hypothetical protein ACR2LM_10520 [Pyrinomonadaceae bacterium]